MTAGSFVGAVLGGPAIGLIAANGLVIGLAMILLISVHKTFQHSKADKQKPSLSWVCIIQKKPGAIS